jgi:DNA-binding response OmpR family regulator
MYSGAPDDSGAFAESASRHVLLAIDDETLCASTSDHLIRHGYVTSMAASTEMPDKVWQVPDIDCLIVDDAGCAGNPTSFCGTVRGVRASMPIIVLGSRDNWEARIDALEAGADDYVPNPVDPRALIARIKAVCRRASRERVGSEPPGTSSYSFGSWRLDAFSHVLHHSDGSAHTLTAREFRLLEALVKNAGQIVPRACLLRMLNGAEGARLEGGLECGISRMRRLLRETTGPASQSIIRSVYGKGYVFAGLVVDTAHDQASGR